MTAMTTLIALALRAAPDVETARQLHDYGTLDDAGVVAALEQTGLRRGDAQRWPAYLARLQQLAVVVDVAGELTLATFAAATLAQENSLLSALFAILPGPAQGQCVAWHGADWPLLQQRAYHHHLPAPAAVHAWPRQALADLFAPGARRDDVLRLYGAEFTAADSVEPVLGDAVHCYLMALRQRCISGQLAPDSARGRAARARARAVQAGSGAPA